MKQKNSLVLRIMGVLIVFFPLLVFANVEGKAGVDKDALMQEVSGLKMPFIENQGQIKDKSVRFYAKTFAGTVLVTDKGEIVYSLQKTEDRYDNSEFQTTRLSSSKSPGSKLQIQDTIIKTVVLRESLECPEQVKIKGISKSPTEVNYFVGSKDKWRTDLPVWQEVSLGKIYERIELKLRAYGKNVEKLFTVYPEGSVEDIKLKIEGARGLKVNNEGELEIETGLGTVKMSKPVAYQEIRGEKKYIQVAYNILSGSESYNFEVGEYDKTKPLVIDPLLSSTFIGAGNHEDAYALAIDSSGNVFAAGMTYSSDYPTISGTYDITNNGSGDVFVSKLDNSLRHLLSSTFIGGNNDEYGYALAIDSSSNVFVTGFTTSSDYPTTAGAYDQTCGTDGDCDPYFDPFLEETVYRADVFVSKLDNNLSSLLASTFIGGGNADLARSLTVNFSGNIVIAGMTYSSDYPTTAGAYDQTCGTDGDCDPYFDPVLEETVYRADVFVSKLDNGLSSLLSSTFIGGSNDEYAYALTIDSSGNAFITGGTNSFDYPATVDAYDTTHNGGYWDGFITKLDNSLSSLLSSTFIGGNKNDYAFALTIDSSDNALITGYTRSSDYPTTSSAYDQTCGTDENCNYASDVFVSKLDNSLRHLLSSTFVGGSNDEYGYALTIDSSGNIFVAGKTHSSDYPTTTGAYDTSHNSAPVADIFITKLDSNLSSLFASTFLGGSSIDDAETLAIDSSGNIFVAGQTWSSDYPTTEGAYDTTYNGSNDVFISRLYNDLSSGTREPDITVIPASINFGDVYVGNASIQTLTISSTGTADLVIGGLSLTGDNPYQFNIQNENCKDAAIAPYEICTVEVVFTPTKTGNLSALVGIDSNDPDTPTLYIELIGTGIKKHKHHSEHDSCADLCKR